MTLKNWLQAGWLVEHKTSTQEIADLLALADRDIATASSSALTADWKHNIAYSAALSCAAAALAACGFRPARGEHHYRLINALSLIMGKECAGISGRLEVARKKRNIGMYERVGAISDGEADELLHLATELRTRVGCWLKKHYPDLTKH
ncbi:MAG: hypothetical protein NTZ78_09920 [Candidatus Aureabacteria bacterium]|nr:hypothetical protein [Candidatus Auribacterota bacterium]